MRYPVLLAALLALSGLSSCAREHGSKTVAAVHETQAVPAPQEPTGGPRLDGAAGPSPTDSRVEELLAKLRELPQGRFLGNAYFDMHGNVNDALQELMIIRFAATQRICTELDSTDRAKLPDYVEALYDVLGFVKDPGSIGWLEKGFKGERAGELNALYMRRWRTFLRGADCEDVRWVEGSAQWSAFFRRLLEHEVDPERRIETLRAMQGWLHDPDTLAFFESQECSRAVRGHELLIAQAYLHQHGRSIDAVRLRATIDELKGTPQGAELLLEFADEIRHEAFVPWLVSVAGPKTYEEGVGSVQWVLEEITFRRDVSGHDEWEAWYAGHGTEGRHVWINEAVREFLQLLAADPTKANAFLERAVYRWKDVMLLPYVDELLKHKVIHNELVGWINLTYRPYWREELRPVAERIIAESGNDLDCQAEYLLKGLDFLDPGNTTWADHVHMDNMRICTVQGIEKQAAGSPQRDVPASLRRPTSGARREGSAKRRTPNEAPKPRPRKPNAAAE
jgi:hypothetical protein